MRKAHLGKVTVFAVLLLLIIAVVIFTGIYTDYTELAEIGGNFTEVFWRNFDVSAVVMAISFLVFFTFILSNFLVVRKNLLPMDSSFSYLKGVSPIVIISAVLGVFFAAYARQIVAHTFLPFLTSEWFNLGDPLFHKDVGYYVFQRPFYLAVIRTLLTFGVFLMVLTALSYVFLYGRFDFYNMKRLLRSKSVVCHQFITVLIFFLIKAVSCRYRFESVLFASNKDFVGGSYVDVNIWVKYYQLLPILLIVIAVLTMIFALNSRYMHAVASMLLYPLSLVIVLIVGQVMQILVVDPNELAVETAYIQNNIDFTRSAYRLDEISSYDYNISNSLTGKDIIDNPAIINNIRLISNNQLIDSANQMQSVRSYYQFTNVDTMPYDINGNKTVVAVSAREMITDKLDPKAKNYINTKMKYTHSTGIVMSPVNTVTEQGQPYFIIRDIPTRSLDGAPDISEPRIYFGEHIKDYVIVGAKDKEYDEIQTGGYLYKGSAGIPLNFLNRALFAAKHSDFRLLVSGQITKESKLLTNRNILTRVQKAAPFLTFDNDIYLLITNNGRLKWVVDGYTTSEWFPYSQYSGEMNYMRNSVKAVVDAYDGNVDFYITDEGDPIARSYRRIYPTLFKDMPFPAELAPHLRYPTEIFKIQSEMLKKYHIDNVADFFEKRDIWANPREKYKEDKEITSGPYYCVIKMPDSGKQEFALLQPYTLVNRANIVSWLAASCEGEGFGRLTALNIPQNGSVYGPQQLDNRIDGDAAILKELEQLDATVIRGNIISLPIKNSVLYVEPVYIIPNKDNGQPPEVKKIIAAYGERIVVKPTLNDALGALFGVNRPTVVATNEETLTEVIEKVVSGFEEVTEFSKQGDWENYGKALKKLEDNIAVLKEKNEESENLSLTE
ncbi:MAG: UPF0182 family protein [Firmicutes bacterium]|nr:UPF0182 family protein [Bacillota bacterium]